MTTPAHHESDRAFLKYHDIKDPLVGHFTGRTRQAVNQGLSNDPHYLRSNSLMALLNHFRRSKPDAVADIKDYITATRPGDAEQIISEFGTYLTTTRMLELQSVCISMPDMRHFRVRTPHQYDAVMARVAHNLATFSAVVTSEDDKTDLLRHAEGIDTATLATRVHIRPQAFMPVLYGRKGRTMDAWIINIDGEFMALGDPLRADAMFSFIDVPKI